MSMRGSRLIISYSPANEAMLPDLCIMLRMACDGAADPWPDQDIETTILYLQDRLDNWTPGTSIVDETVRQLVWATLREVERIRGS